MKRRPRHELLALALGLLSAGLSTDTHAAAMITVPDGTYLPLTRAANAPGSVPVPSFFLDEFPVANADYLAFVTACPPWRRSRVSPLFADTSYLENWHGDLEPGPAAPACAPVVHVSWFAARAYARWAAKRLPSTAEWESAASTGLNQAEGKTDAALKKLIYDWLAHPVPHVLPGVETAATDFHGVRGLHGLVWEWVDDFSTSMVTGESRADSGLDRDLFCGAGSIGARDPTDYAAFMRQALFASLKANHTTGALGFRCARDITPAATAPILGIARPPEPGAEPFSARSLYQIDATFITDGGNLFRLEQLRGHSVVVAMFFASCGYACPLIIGDMQSLERQLPESIATDTRFVLVSFDTARDTPDRLAELRQQRSLGPRWLLLHGGNDAVTELAALLGAKFQRQSDGGFAHSNLITVLNFQGEITRQRSGFQDSVSDLIGSLAPPNR